MSENNLVKIKQFTSIGEDERGLTAQFSLPRQQDNFIFITRNAGSLSGNTWHEGKTPATNPKIFILLDGNIKLSWRKINTAETYQANIMAPATIEVSPHVTHNVEALSDCKIIECNSLGDILNDRHRENVQVGSF